MAYHNIDNTPSARVYTDTSQTLMGLGGDPLIDSGDLAQVQARMTGVTATTMPISTDLFRLGVGARAPIAPNAMAQLSPGILKLISPGPVQEPTITCPVGMIAQRNGAMITCTPTGGMIGGSPGCPPGQGKQTFNGVTSCKPYGSGPGGPPTGPSSGPPQIGGSRLSLPPGSRGPAPVGGSQLSIPPGYRVPPADTTPAPTTDATPRDSTSTGEWLSPLLTVGVFIAGIAVLLYKK